MDIASLGFRTDVALLALGGSQVEDAGDHLVVRTPHNPAYRWGNFLLLREPPAAGEQWLQRFAAAFPDADYVALGVDGARRDPADLAGLTALGLELDLSTVLTATAVHPPHRPNHDATYRRLVSDDDWERSVHLAVACNDDEEPVGYVDFVRGRTGTWRALTEAGHGGWFGAFLGDRLVSQMGLLAASPGLARFQSVETHPEARGAGLAGSLVHHVSGYGFDALAARTLVMVADPDYPAIRIYAAVGFVAAESQVQAERRPAPVT